MSPPIPRKSFSLKEKVKVIQCEDFNGSPIRKVTKKFKIEKTQMAEVLKIKMKCCV